MIIKTGMMESLLQKATIFPKRIKNKKENQISGKKAKERIKRSKKLRWKIV